MRFLDLFAGVGGIRLGMEQAGHSCVGWVEWDKFARKSYVAIHKPEGEFTEKDINNVNSQELPKADCWCFGFPCSPAGTKVKTSDGYKNVEDIVKGDLLLTHKGNYKPVVKTMNRMAPAINTIKAKGVYGLKLTDNHPVYVFNTSTHKFEWIKVAELDKKIHLLTLNINSQNQKLKLSDDQLWLLGRYVADGYLPNNGKTYTDFSIRASKREQFETHLDNYSFLLEHESRNCPEYILQDLEFRELASRFGMGAKNKKIPQWLQDAPTDQIKVFIDGYLSGDGCVEESRTMWSTVSEDLALGLQALYVKAFHKIPAIYIRKDKRSQTFNDTYNSQIHSKDVGTLIVGNYMCTRIKSIVRQEKMIKVYNMEVKDDNSYTLDNVIVHNCQDISVAGKQGGFTNGKRSSLFFKVTGLIRELKEEDKPSYLFIENVKNLLSINKGWDFAKLLIEMDEIGYDVEWDVLDSAEVVPQHRERVFIVGHLREQRTRKVFPIVRKNGETNKTIKEVAKIYQNRHSSDGNSVLDTSGISYTVTAHASKDAPKIMIKQVGNISNSKSFNGNPQTGRVYDTNGISPTLSTMQGGGQEPKIAIPVSSPDIVNKKQNGRRFKENGDPEFSLTTRDRHGILTNSYDEVKQVASSVKKYANVTRPNAKPIVRITSKKDIRGARQDSKKSGLSELQFTNPNNKSSTVIASHAPKTWDKELRIRKLTPLECWRLQGFPDWAFNRAREAGLSDSQLYKQAGNSVTVPVIKAIADRMEILNN